MISSWAGKYFTLIYEHNVLFSKNIMHKYIDTIKWAAQRKQKNDVMNLLVYQTLLEMLMEF